MNARRNTNGAAATPHCDRGYTPVHLVVCRSATCRPRIHDLRHSFAVRTLVDWYSQGADVQAKLPLLSTYMGHVQPADTYWYLSAAP